MGRGNINNKKPKLNAPRKSKRNIGRQNRLKGLLKKQPADILTSGSVVHEHEQVEQAINSEENIERKQILKQGRSNSGKQVYSEIQLSEFNSAETLETIKQEQLESLDTAITIKEEPLECNPVNIAITASENVCVMDNCISVKAEPDFIDIKQETDEDQATQTWQSTMEEKPHPIDQDVPTELDRFDLIFQDLAKRFKQFSSSRQITVINTLCSVIAKAEIEEREEQS